MGAAASVICISPSNKAQCMKPSEACPRASSSLQNNSELSCVGVERAEERQ